MLSLDMAYRSFREVLAGSTPASIRRLQSIVVTQIPAYSGARAPVDAQHAGAACFEKDERPARAPLEASLRLHRRQSRGVPASRKLVRCVVNELLFLEQPSGRRRLACMPMSDEQIKEQLSYLETRIERQRAIIDGLEAEGYGGEVIRRSRVLLKQMIADLDQLLLQLREARQINVIKAEQKISSSASDASSQNSIDW